MVGLAGRFPDRWLLQLKQPAGQMECVGGPGRPGLLWSLQPEFKSPPLQMGDPGQFWVSRAGRQVHRDKRRYVAHTGALAGRRNPPPGSPQRAGRRFPHRQAGVEQQRPETTHRIPTRQAGQHRPLLHQPGQPRAGALADLGARVLELREESRCQRRRRAQAQGPRQRRAGLPPGSERAPPLAAPASPRLTFSSSSAAGPSSSSPSVPFAAAASA